MRCNITLLQKTGLWKAEERYTPSGNTIVEIISQYGPYILTMNTDDIIMATHIANVLNITGNLDEKDIRRFTAAMDIINKRVDK